MTLNTMMNRIEKLCDEHKAQVTITRASRIWIGFVRVADGRTAQHQSPLDQKQLLADTLDSLDKMTGANK